jgi:hypothetical protein
MGKPVNNEETMTDFANDILIELEKLIKMGEVAIFVRSTPNSIDSAVKLVHVPSGMEVECEEYESQVKNKAIVRLLQLLIKAH